MTNDTNTQPAPRKRLTMGERIQQRWLEDQARHAARQDREAKAVLQSMYRENTKGRRP